MAIQNKTNIYERAWNNKETFQNIQKDLKEHGFFSAKKNNSLAVAIHPTNNTPQTPVSKAKEALLTQVKKYIETSKPDQLNDSKFWSGIEADLEAFIAHKMDKKGSTNNIQSTYKVGGRLINTLGKWNNDLHKEYQKDRKNNARDDVNNVCADKNTASQLLAECIEDISLIKYVVTKENTLSAGATVSAKIDPKTLDTVRQELNALQVSAPDILQSKAMLPPQQESTPSQQAANVKKGEAITGMIESATAKYQAIVNATRKDVLIETDNPAKSIAIDESSAMLVKDGEGKLDLTALREKYVSHLEQRYPFLKDAEHNEVKDRIKYNFGLVSDKEGITEVFKIWKIELSRLQESRLRALQVNPSALVSANDASKSTIVEPSGSIEASQVNPTNQTIEEISLDQIMGNVPTTSKISQNVSKTADFMANRKAIDGSAASVIPAVTENEVQNKVPTVVAEPVELQKSVEKNLQDNIPLPLANFAKEITNLCKDNALTKNNIATQLETLYTKFGSDKSKMIEALNKYYSRQDESVIDEKSERTLVRTMKNLLTSDHIALENSNLNAIAHEIFIFYTTNLNQKMQLSDQVINLSIDYIKQSFKLGATLSNEQLLAIKTKLQTFVSAENQEALGTERDQLVNKLFGDDFLKEISEYKRDEYREILFQKISDDMITSDDQLNSELQLLVKAQKDVQGAANKSLVEKEVSFSSIQEAQKNLHQKEQIKQISLELKSIKESVQVEPLEGQLTESVKNIREEAKSIWHNVLDSADGSRNNLISELEFVINGRVRNVEGDWKLKLKFDMAKQLNTNGDVAIANKMFKSLIDDIFTSYLLPTDAMVNIVVNKLIKNQSVQAILGYEGNHFYDKNFASDQTPDTNHSCWAFVIDRMKKIEAKLESAQLDAEPLPAQNEDKEDAVMENFVNADFNAIKSQLSTALDKALNNQIEQLAHSDNSVELIANADIVEAIMLEVDVSQVIESFKFYAGKDENYSDEELRADIKSNLQLIKLFLEDHVYPKLEGKSQENVVEIFQDVTTQILDRVGNNVLVKKSESKKEFKQYLDQSVSGSKGNMIERLELINQEVNKLEILCDRYETYLHSINKDLSDVELKKTLKHNISFVRRVMSPPISKLLNTYSTSELKFILKELKRKSSHMVPTYIDFYLKSLKT